VHHRPRLALLGLTGFGLAAFVALDHAGTGVLSPPDVAHPETWAAWAASRTPGQVAAALVRVAAMAMSGWLVLTVAFALVASIRPASRVGRGAHRLAPAAIRRVVEAALGAGLSVSVALPATPAFAAPPPAAADDVAVLHRLDETPEEMAPEEMRPPPAPATPVGSPTWIVEPGDHLWGIAERILEEAWGRRPADHEIAPFWRALVDENRSHLVRASNPSLIYPGQTFDVPAPPGSS
jgi:hypothetical protein